MTQNRKFMIECLNQIPSNYILDVEDNGGYNCDKFYDINIHGMECVLYVCRIYKTEWSFRINLKTSMKKDYWSMHGWIEKPIDQKPYLQGDGNKGLLKKGKIPKLKEYSAPQWFESSGKYYA